MSIVSDRINAAKPAPPAVDSKGGKLAPGQINNNKDLDVEIKKEEPSFFGSFFSTKATQKKKGGPVMEAVSFILVHNRSSCMSLSQRGVRLSMLAASYYPSSISTQ
jgi:hypothetical protein